MNDKNLILIIICILFSELIISQNIIKKDISYVSTNETDVYKKERCKLDISYFKDKTERPVVVFFHGGGLTTGEKYFPGLYGKNLAYIEVTVNYRLSPIAKCPAYLEDAAEAIAWVWNNIEKYGGDKKKIIVTGNSAGAYLAAMMAMDTSYLKKYDINSDNIWIYFTESAQLTTHFTIMAERGLYVGSDYPMIDKYAPLYYNQIVKSYVVLANGDKDLDMAGRSDQNTKMYQKMNSLGIKVTHWEFTGESHTSVGEVARQKFVEELKKGTFDLTLGMKNFIEAEDEVFEANAGTLFTILGQKVKDNPTFDDLEKGVCYIYKTKSSRYIKILRR